MGTFGRLVFCAVRTQIVGKTKFFDSLNTARKSGVFFEAVEGLRQPLARNHAFERILKKNRALRAHGILPIRSAYQGLALLHVHYTIETVKKFI